MSDGSGRPGAASAAVDTEPAIRIEGLGKMYRVFGSRSGTLVDALGLSRLLPARRVRYQEFWALRGIDLELEKGSRLGIIGRNGAGKTTLLKLITGAVAPTEGTIETAGTVQALLEASAGLHPEFTGRENIRAALTYQGLKQRQFQAAEEDIADFTELESFLDQPFRTYSLGMQSRLGFAIATTVEPEILIVDEVLGAGDAYFMTKSIGRMSKLIDGGASVLLVSHALEHVLRFCSEAIWLERGQVMERGPALEVVKSYSEFIRVLEDRKLRARNRNVGIPRDVAQPVEMLVVRMRALGTPGAEACDVGAIRLLADDRVEDELVVGAPQDTQTSHSAALLPDRDGLWSSPRTAEEGTFRTLAFGPDGAASGAARFEVDGLSLGSGHAFELLYRAQTDAVEVELVRDDSIVASTRLPATNGTWERARIAVPVHGSGAPRADLSDRSQSGAGQLRTRRWPGEGSLVIETVELLDDERRERAVFDVGTPLVLRLSFRAQRAGRFDVVPVAVLYRLDGILVSRFIGDGVALDLAEGEQHEAVLRLASLNLGDDDYVFAVALYKMLDINDFEPSEYYDLLDRNYQFKVVGTPALERGIFRHPAEWTVD
jgi:lipopolysaccharide transport system ATP-binding protein